MAAALHLGKLIRSAWKIFWKSWFFSPKKKERNNYYDELAVQVVKRWVY